MAELTLDEVRALYADRVPVYVRASSSAIESTWDVVASATGETLATGFASPKAALADALREHMLEHLKPVHFRSLDTGEADGEWRWLDACATEDEPIYGARLTEQAMWSMSASVNERASAIPIDGGEAGAGFGPSRAHGSGDNAAELANGWVHAAAPVVAEDGRCHLYLYSELLPEVAREVDRGRLAYGSVGFGWDDDGADENGNVYEATLLHHALLNQPAVNTLTPGSQRIDHAPRTGVRTRRLDMSKPTPAPKSLGARLLPLALALSLRAAAEPDLAKALRMAPLSKRGPAMEKLRALASTLGMSVEQALDGDEWRPAIVDIICKLVDAGKLETILEGNPGSISGESELAAVLAKMVRGWSGPREQVDAALKIMEGETIDLDALAKVLEGLAAAAGDKPKEKPTGEKGDAPPDGAGARAIEGLDGPALEAWQSDMLAVGRAILGKPEAMAAEVLTELQASQDVLAAALANVGSGDNGQPSDSPSGAPTGAELATERTAHASTRAERDSLRAERDSLKAKVERGEHRDWLRSEVAIRKMALPETIEAVVDGKRTMQPNQRFESVLDVVCKTGRDAALVVLDLAHAPPSGMLLRNARGPAGGSSAPSTFFEAVDACMADARSQLEAAHPGKPFADHYVRGAAQRLAAQRYPSLINPAPEGGAPTTAA